MNTEEHSEKREHGEGKQDKMRPILHAATLLALAVLAVGVVVGWELIEPDKSLEVSVLWAPPIPLLTPDPTEYNPFAHEGIVYRIYYVWDDECEDSPWWIITNSLDGQWRVIDAKGSDDYSTRPEDNAIFDDEWIERGPRHVQRTPSQMVQKILFGTDLIEEEETFKTVLALIAVQEGYEEQGRDLFDAMRAYMRSHPDSGYFWPPSRDYFDDDIQQLRDEHLSE